MKKVFTIFSLIAIMFVGSFILSACDKNNNQEEQGLQGTQAAFYGFEQVNENTYKISIANSMQYLNLNEIVQVSTDSNWTLHPDITATQTIPSKVASPLVVGDNTFYVLVTASNSNVKLYVLQIRKRPIYMVSFDSMNGTTVNSQMVEEGFKAQKPQDPTKTGYTFIDWDYDFDMPITSDTTITANYTINKYKIIYKLNDDSNNDIINEYFTIEDLEYNLKIPTRENYTFVGWHLNENLLDDCIFTINSIGDKKLFAEWEYGTEGLQYELTSYGYYAIVGYIGNSKNIIIPNTHLGKNVKVIRSLRNSLVNENIITELYISSNIWCITSEALRSISNSIKSITIEAVDDYWKRSYYDDRTHELRQFDMRQEVDISDPEQTATYMISYYDYYLTSNNFYNTNKQPLTNDI